MPAEAPDPYLYDSGIYHCFGMHGEG